MDKGNALVIGASGGMGAGLVKQLQGSKEYTKVFAVSRCMPSSPVQGVNYADLDSADERQVADYCLKLRESEGAFSLVVCCIGALHGVNEKNRHVTPEKRLEDINAEQLNFYFTINTILPAIWLKYLVVLAKGAQPAKLVFFNARVGSINDNHLGGWYGYRASKTALNMLLKSAQIEYKRRAKNVAIVSYHPGTVDTELSEPFQAKVPKGKLFSVEFSVSQLLGILPSLTLDGAPHYVDWQGLTIPW